MEALKNAIFISYRRADLSEDQVNVVHEGLEKEFGDDSVFLDISDIHSGAKWKQVLNEAGTGAKICLVMIGKDWLEKDKQGQYRIQNPDDWVRKEIEYAIEKNLHIIPTLINGGELPAKSEVPESIHLMFDSQTMTLDLNRWYIYKEKFFKDIRTLLQLENKVEIKKIVRFDPKRLWLLLLIPVLFGLIYVFNKRSPIENTELSKPSDSLKVNELVCKPFDPNSEIKSLIFPIFSRDLQSAKEASHYIEGLLTDQCRKAGLIPENQFAVMDPSIDLTKSKKLEIARSCGADLYFSGILLQGNDQSFSFKSDFNLTVDSIGAYIPNPEELRLHLVRFSIHDLVGNEITEKIEKLVQFIVGIFAYQKGHYAQSVNSLKSILAQGITNDSIKQTAYRIIADSYYKMMDDDSSLYYQQLYAANYPSAQATLKTAYLADLYKKPGIAIPEYTKLIESNQYNKDLLLEKRADQYLKVNDFSNAKKDYDKVQKTENNKGRINDKIKQVDKNILINQPAVTKANHFQGNDQEKIKLADQLLQNGYADKANELLQTINKSSNQFKQAEPLIQEAQLKVNPETAIITESAVKLNPRLKAEAGILKKPVKQGN